MGGVWDLNDNGTISCENKKAATMIYHPLLLVFLMKVTLYKLKFIEPSMISMILGGWGVQNLAKPDDLILERSLS